MAAACVIAYPTWRLLFSVQSPPMPPTPPPPSLQPIGHPLPLSLERELSVIERQVYDLETHYLEDTAGVGNVVRGWDTLKWVPYPHEPAAGAA